MIRHVEANYIYILKYLDSEVERDLISFYYLLGT